MLVPIRPRIVTIREAAKALKVSDRHIRRMMILRKFPFYRIGSRAVRLDLDEILAATKRPTECRHTEDDAR